MQNLAPLAERMRPQNLDEYVGQKHLVGTNAVLRKAIESGKSVAGDEDHELSGEVMAAISAAIYEMSQDMHDVESTILTL